MIVVDIETSSIRFDGGIFQIGAVNTENIAQTFFDECRIDDNDTYSNWASEVNGVTEEKLRNESKLSQKDLLIKFFEWCKVIGSKNFICHNPQFDYAFIKTKSEKYGLDMPVHFRCFDIHTIASIKYFQIHKQFLLKEGKSDMGLPNVLKFCGMEDLRDKHNALEDAELTTECFSRMIYGKNSLEKYSKFPIPDYLRK